MAHSQPPGTPVCATTCHRTFHNRYTRRADRIDQGYGYTSMAKAAYDEYRDSTEAEETNRDF
ncbi:hypothetical protein Areg01_89510 [Actinoplanes regularis]|nr:hypothetical protein Areg01_89510 [Actinoplanes regularis]